jgi:hypothetical protein
MAKRELKTSDLKESAAGLSGFCEPEQRNAAAGVSVIHSSSPAGEWTKILGLLGVFIAWYHNTSAAAWIYLAMHGACCLVWIIKDLAFPDPNFHKRITVGARHRQLPQRAGLVVGVWLAADFARVARPEYPCRTMPGSACA